MKIDLIGGARPNFVKIAPIYAKLKEAGEDPRFIHTGQHELSDMGVSIPIPEPFVVLGENSIPGIPYLARMLFIYEVWVQQHKPDIIIVTGDTDSSFVGAYIGKRYNIPIVHIESGVRAYRNNIEETNRVAIDHMSDLLFTPFEGASDILRKENVTGHIETVGNIMIDSLIEIVKSESWIGIDAEKYDILVTMHRQENVDNPDRFSKILRAVHEVSKVFNIIFPIHPRSKDKLDRFGFEVRSYMVDPFPYTKMLKTMSKAKMVITDSGGVPAEASYFGVPSLLMSEVTGWTNLLESGHIKLTNPDTLVNDTLDFFNVRSVFKIDLWDGKTSDRIVDAILRWSNEHICR